MKLKYGFAQLTPTRLCIFAAVVHLAMTTLPGSQMFAALIALANALKINIDQLLDAIAETNSTAAKEMRMQLKAQLVTQLTLLGMEVERISAGDLVMLASSGFELKKHGVPSTEPMPAPLNVRVDPYGLTGVVQVRCKAVKYSRNVVVQHATIDGEWITMPTFPSTRDMLIPGLVRGTEVKVRVCVNGPTGTGDWSDIATTLVL